jgi:small-conductance mechanosensitive channel
MGLEMESWIARTAAWTGLELDLLTGLLETAGVLLVVLLLRGLLLRVAARRVEDVTRHYYIRRTITYATTGVLILGVGRIWFTGFGGLATFLGLLGAGVAIALGDLLANLAGWLFILIRRPFEVGDRVQIGDKFGDVIDVRLFNTYLMECGHWVQADQSTGRMLLIPNGKIFKEPVANYTRGFAYIWDEIPVLVTFESDWRRAKEILSEIASEHGIPLSTGAQDELRKAAGKHMIVFRNLNPIVYTSVQDSGVLLTLRFLTPPRQRRTNQQTIWEAILDAFAQEPTIDFAYPSQRHYLNFIEGKPGTKP